jgi:hypothetical protein
LLGCIALPAIQEITAAKFSMDSVRQIVRGAVAWAIFAQYNTCTYDVEFVDDIARTKSVMTKGSILWPASSSVFVMKEPIDRILNEIESTSSLLTLWSCSSLRF